MTGTRRQKPNPGSVQDRLSSLEVGERLYIETTYAGYAAVERAVSLTRSRRSVLMQDREFSSTLLTAISALDPTDVRYLVCAERTT